MMECAELLTHWVEQVDGEIKGVFPALSVDHPAIGQWKEVTGNLPFYADNPDIPDLSQPTAEPPTWNPNPSLPVPNSFIVKFEAETAVMDAIEADENYTIMPGTRRGL